MAAQFPDLAFLPQRGVGVDGKPTKNYVSAFVCEGFARAVANVAATFGRG